MCSRPSDGDATGPASSTAGMIRTPNNVAARLIRDAGFAPGVSGVVRWNDGFLMWGKGGLRPVTRDLRCVPMTAEVRKGLPAGAIQSLSTAGARLHVLDEKGEMQVFDGGNRKIATEAQRPRRPRQLSPAPWFDHVSRVGRLLARRDEVGGVELWTIGRSAQLG